MKENLRRLAILFSVVLNIAFLGTYVYREVPLWARSRHFPQGDLPYQELQLTQVQEHELEPLRNAFHARLHHIGTELQREQLRLVDALAQPTLDRGSLSAVQEKIRDLQKAMQDAVIEHLIRQDALFTPAQRARFFAILRERVEKAQPPSPPWIPRPENASGSGGG